MAPTTKVTLLLNQECHSQNENVFSSGPYSILYLDNSLRKDKDIDEEFKHNESTEDLRRQILTQNSFKKGKLQSESKPDINLTFSHEDLSIKRGLKLDAKLSASMPNSPEDVSKDFDITSECLSASASLNYSKKRTNDEEVTFKKNISAQPESKKRRKAFELKDRVFLSSKKEISSIEDIFCQRETETKKFKSSIGKIHKGLEKPSSLPQLRILHQPPTGSFSNLKQLDYSQPIRSEFLDDLRKLRSSSNENDSSKRDSLECEESLGILTPDQMDDFTHSLEFDVSSSEGRLNNPTNQPEENQQEVHSPNLNHSSTEYSLSLIDPDQVSGFMMLKSDTTINLDLPLDASVLVTDFIKETPSPEELPLDATPVVESEPSKTESTKTKTTTNSFVTSITSITSLDTGYQGDGEMSRPASRGAENSPLTRRPFSKSFPRKPDPMTDSDFYTESDADNHDDNQLKGDRRAQVIDGTLYGVDPQTAADIYMNNRENMDSSGVFTDIESGLRNSDDIDNDNESGVENNNKKSMDVSPSDSTKTIAENTQVTSGKVIVEEKIAKENSKKRISLSPGVVTPPSVTSPRRLKDDTKKYKMPKRDVASKVKAMIVENVVNEKRTQVKKIGNKWDAVMNKISKNDQTKTNLKEVRSRVFDNVNMAPNSPRAEMRTNSTQSQISKSRRVRVRTLANPSSPPSIKNSLQSSIHSSVSDLSASATHLKKNTNTLSTKKKETGQVTQVLTANKISAKHQPNLSNNKNARNTNSPSLLNKTTNTRVSTLSPKEKKINGIQNESAKQVVKGSRTSSTVQGPTQFTHRVSLKKATATVPRTTEALAVLVQHLVFNIGAYQVPHLQRQVEKYRLEAENIHLTCKDLKALLEETRLKHQAFIEDERVKFREDVNKLKQDHQNYILQLTGQHDKKIRQLNTEKNSLEQHVKQKYHEQLAALRRELDKLQKSHDEALEILREENDCIREQIDEQRLELEKAREESDKLKNDYHNREEHFKGEVLELLKAQKDKLKQHFAKLETDYEGKITLLEEKNLRLKEENDRLLNYGDHKDIAKQEVQSLRVVLELKQNEISELRKSLEEARQRQIVLEGAEEKSAALQARCEDLQLQLQRKNEYEQTLIQENQKLQESFKDEVKHSKRLSQLNEELQWKLKQNKEIVTKVIEQAEESVFNRSNLFNSTANENHYLERSVSLREASQRTGKNLESSVKLRKSKNSSADEHSSPPSSPKIKGVVKKSDSVSYVLDLDESPDLVASRILRRSFRNPTPPKQNVLSKSHSNKQLVITKTTKEECYNRPKSANSGHSEDDDDVFDWQPNNIQEKKKHFSVEENLDLDDENDEELQLPALPSEMDKTNGALTLPSPKRLAADAAGSDSNSDDESTSSSQL
ncbi:hypothetical protein ABEB36_012908 [Hypothenemus hampei]|uniref:Uncharacterized protein n=1 Tax=Hypothenemus hampei TaxID=57062 RepID=A0ABD1E724_HYPHA